MALLHRATLTPTKRELLDGWLPSRPWYDGAVERGPVGAFRLDDPDGEVGIEGFLLGSVDGATLFVPLTYRPAALEGADEHLVGTTEHSVLGTRWVYDGCGDPVWVAALATAIRSGGQQADEEFEVEGRREVRAPTTTVRGSGLGGPDARVPPTALTAVREHGPLTTATMGDVALTVVRVLGTDLDTSATLTGRLDAGSPELLLAGLSTSD